MGAPKAIVLFGIISLSFLCCVYMRNYKKDFKAALLLMGRGLFLLVLSSWLLSLLYTRLRSSSPSSPTPQARSEYEDVSQKRELARKDQQERHSEKASTYQESVLKPRQEARLQNKEQRFYRMTGEAWKLTRGQLLGEGDPSTEHLKDEDIDESPNVKAIRRRKLPETVSHIPAKADVPKEKRVVVLPDEPPENAEGMVRVVLRCPSGRTIQRKFFKSHSSRVLLDWMLKSGFPPHIYAICTSYPRRPLRMEKDLSLEDAGIDTDTVLNVEEMDLPQSEIHHLSD
uniref:UBX domain protein 8 n=1 Tax=Paramormyrops kingsleyae TaxID=1676925 RepID=A0A3B3QY26_9TELE|nr:UBX domain-containing protein 8 isoform X1 [Paramormyrops kingsleyae]